MEKQYKHSVNGQGVYEDDLNMMGEAGALADDRVFAELFKLGGIGIIPTGRVSAFTGGGCVVHAYTGGVVIQPFRALVGPTVDESTNVLESWRGGRSGIFVGSSTRSFIQTLDANNSSATRWDVIYAVLIPDKNGASETRKVKDPATGTISTQSISTFANATVEIRKVTGSTTVYELPALPSEGNGEHFIPLAYVRVFGGFNGSTLIDPCDIWDVAPTILLHDCVGAVTAKPATCQFTPNNGPYVGRQAYQGVPDMRATTYMPPSMTGGETRLIAIDNTGGGSLSNGDVVDDSIDWSNRIFKWTVFAHAAGDTPAFAWEEPISPSEDRPIPSAINGAIGSSMAIGMGQTCFTDVTGKRLALHLNSAKLSALGAGNEITLYTDTGGSSLKIGITGTPGVKLFIWLEASGQFTNR